MSAPSPPPFPDANEPVNNPRKDPPPPPLQYTTEELDIVHRFLVLYQKLQSTLDRHHMLMTKILPQLVKLNTHLTEGQWKIRKRVSGTLL
jgi:hypothetical protein